VPPVTATANHLLNANFGFSQNYVTGTQFSMSFNTLRESSSLSTFLLNPFVQTTMTMQVTQPLLNGFGILPNTRYNHRGEEHREGREIAILAASNDHGHAIFE